MTDKKQTEERLPAEVRANILSNEQSIFFNVALFEQAQRVATMFANSTMVPEHFRNNVGNCMIGLNYAARLQADPFMVLQCLYVVHGRPGIEGKLVEAAINASGKYSEPLDYAWLDPEDKPVERHTVLNHKDFDGFGCQAFSIDAKSGKRVDGPKITWKLIKAEGWYDKTGSKWKTMPEMMFYYRAASWFGNKNCPELKLGMQTVEELKDMPIKLTRKQNGSYAATDFGKSVDEDLIKQFHNTVNDLEAVNQDNLTTFLSKSAETFNKSIEEIKVEAIKDFDGFWKQFRIWEDSQRGVSDDDRLRSEFINLRSAGFSTWVHKNLDRIVRAPSGIQKELNVKWSKFYSEPFPVKPGLVHELPEDAPPIVNGATGEILDQPVTTELESDVGQLSEELQTQLNYLADMRTFKAELNLAAYNRVLMVRNYQSMNDVPPEKQDEILVAMSSELDAQNTS